MRKCVAGCSAIIVNGKVQKNAALKNRDRAYVCKYVCSMYILYS